MDSIPGSLRALLAHLIDYAGFYPPAALPLDEVGQRYERYLESPQKWMLNRLVVPASRFIEMPMRGGWRISLMVEGEPGDLPPQVETLEAKSGRTLSLPTYCEVPIRQIDGGFAKVRTGGLIPEAIPSVESLAGFLAAASARRLAFKATAGLHHPIRSERPLTYAVDAPRAMMHGFLNVFTAAAFAWHATDRDALLPILSEQDPKAFEFRDDELRYKGLRLSTRQVEAARNDFAHCFGSCSFEEPIADLRELGLLP